MAHDQDDEELQARQLALVKWQQQAIADGEKVLIIFEGRDAAGKDGSIRVLTAQLSVRNTRGVAAPQATHRKKTQWYFQRYAPHLPAGGETVIFNRSWYNRAGVERVMGFCTSAQHVQFLRDAPRFEQMLAE